MIVVSDTSPLNYLILTESVHVLPAMFGRVHTTSAVIVELLHAMSPVSVRAWASSLPEWLIVRDTTNFEPLLKLGVGEASAISLALELKADRVLIDDRDGARAARRNGLSVVGTLGILEQAAYRGIVDIEHISKNLKETNFRASEELYRTVVRRVIQEQLSRASGESKST